MDNFLVCNNCKTVNALYASNCKTCRSFLRTKVANIDLWDSVWDLLTEPGKITVKLIQSEKKNFLISLLCLWMFKSAVNNYILKNYLLSETDYVSSFTKSLFEGGIISIGILALFSLFMTSIFNAFKLKTRFKDNFTIYTYSLTPILLSFVFLTPFHFALYGFYWFTVNPSPLIIKPLISYVLYGIEGLFTIWSLILFMIVTYVQSKNIILSIITGIVLSILLMGFHFLQV